MTFLREFALGFSGGGTFFDGSLSGTIEDEMLPLAAADFPTGIILPPLADNQAYAMRLEAMGTVEGDFASDIDNATFLFGWDSAPTLPESNLGQYILSDATSGGLNAIGIDNVKLSAEGEVILGLSNQFVTNKYHFKHKVTVSPAMGFGFNLAQV